LIWEATNNDKLPAGAADLELFYVFGRIPAARVSPGTHEGLRSHDAVIMILFEYKLSSYILFRAATNNDKLPSGASDFESINMFGRITAARVSPGTHEGLKAHDAVLMQATEASGDPHMGPAMDVDATHTSLWEYPYSLMVNSLLFCGCSNQEI
jgi:hypothetical protein